MRTQPSHYTENNSPMGRARKRRYLESHREAVRKRNRAQKAKQRALWKGWVFTLLGGLCRCCKEAHPAFLSIDHVDGGGKKELEGLGRDKYYRQVTIFVADNPGQRKYQILCHNCNFAKHFYPGGCPHGGNRRD